MEKSFLQEEDPEVFRICEEERKRQEENLILIASENLTSQAVREAYTSFFTHKYAEGYPGKRYYGGCDFADKIESLAQERVKKLFSSSFANVQPHSGAQANFAVFLALLKPGDPFLGMDLSHGGHLTHGSKVNFSGKIYQAHFYGVDPITQRISYDKIWKIAKEVKPRMIIAGFSSYPRKIDFAKFKEIAEEVSAYLLADIAHIAGLIAANLHPTPVGYADIVTFTTHKTLRGPRGGVILTEKEELAKKMDSALFPGTQGGPLMHVIAAKAVAFKEALHPSFKEYQEQVLKNAQALADSLLQEGVELITGGTDNHIVLIDVYKSFGITGKEAQEILEKAHISTNKNTIPFDPHPPRITSGIRLGSPYLTSRGLKEEEFRKIGKWIVKLLKNPEEKNIEKIQKEVTELLKSFPIPKSFVA